MITEERMKELKELAEKATPGPWEAGYSHWGQSDVIALRHDSIDGHVGLKNGIPFVRVAQHSEILIKDAEFIAAARQAVPELIQEIERLKREVTTALTDWDFARNELEEKTAEVERLKAKLAEFGDYQKHVDNLKASTKQYYQLKDNLRETYSVVVAERDAALEKLGTAVNSLAERTKERDALKEELEARTTGVHSCNAKCRIPVCVFRRERDAALARVKELEEALEKYGIHRHGPENKCGVCIALTQDTRESEGA